MTDPQTPTLAEVDSLGVSWRCPRMSEHGQERNPLPRPCAECSSVASYTVRGSASNDVRWHKPAGTFIVITDPSWSVERLRQVIARGLAVESEQEWSLTPDAPEWKDVSVNSHNALLARLMAAGETP